MFSSVSSRPASRRAWAFRCRAFPARCRFRSRCRSSISAKTLATISGSARRRRTVMADTPARSATLWSGSPSASASTTNASARFRDPHAFSRVLSGSALHLPRAGCACRSPSSSRSSPGCPSRPGRTQSPGGSELATVSRGHVPRLLLRLPAGLLGLGEALRCAGGRSNHCSGTDVGVSVSRPQHKEGPSPRALAVAQFVSGVFPPGQEQTSNTMGTPPACAATHNRAMPSTRCIRSGRAVAPTPPELAFPCLHHHRPDHP
jgi:hypothetical protein